jgi:hypothetical protein
MLSEGCIVLILTIYHHDYGLGLARRRMSSLTVHKGGDDVDLVWPC